MSSHHQESLLNSQMLGLSGCFCGKQEGARLCVWIDRRYVWTQNLRDPRRNLCHARVGRGLSWESEVLAKGRPPEAKNREDQQGMSPRMNRIGGVLVCTGYMECGLCAKLIKHRKKNVHSSSSRTSSSRKLS